MTGAWNLALRSLSRNRRRNLVTGLAIALGYAGLVLLSGYVVRAERLLRASSVYLQHTGHVAVWAKGGLERAEAKPSAYALSGRAVEEIETALRADPRVEFTGRYLLGGGIAGNGCDAFPFRAVGIDLAAERRILAHPEVSRVVGDLARPRAGRPLPDVDPAGAPVTLGVRLAHSIGKSPAPAGAPPPSAPPEPLDCEAPDARERIAADPFVQLAARTHDGAFGASDVWVAGVFQAPTTEADKTAVVAGLETLQRIYDTERVTYVAAFLRDARDAADVATAAARRLASAGLEVSVHRYDDPAVNPYYVGTKGFLGVLAGFIALLVAAVVALSVLNAMTLAVLERARELGTYRALGFTRGQLLGILLREAAVLSLLALATGLALGLGGAALVNAANLPFEPPGVGGRIQLVLSPDPLISVVIAVPLLALTLAATTIAVRRKVKERVTTLIAEVAA